MYDKDEVPCGASPLEGNTVDSIWQNMDFELFVRVFGDARVVERSMLQFVGH